MHPDYLLYAGGNYNFGFGAGEDHSVWRLMPFDGARACAWAARGASGLLATADDAAGCPPLVADAFGEGAAGLHFDGSTDQLRLAEPDLQPAGPVEPMASNFIAGIHSMPVRFTPGR